MKRVVGCLALILLLFVGCSSKQEPKPIEAVGRWRAEESPEYYFDLQEDGSCTMFSADGEWLSAGTYQVQDDLIAFSMDTGSFTWVRAEDTDALVFEAGGKICHYRKEQ